MKLQEWSKDKAVIFIKRIFDIVGKKTGQTFKIVQIPKLYQNKWGKFIGYYLVSSHGTVYRANFILGKDTENIVSIDKFSASDDLFEVPLETLSMEGFNVMQVFNCLLDWVIGNGDVFRESYDDEDHLQERISWIELMDTFLGEQPQWVKDAEAEKLDTKKLHIAFTAFCKDRGVKSDSPGKTLRDFKGSIERGAVKGVSKAVAKSIPIPVVFKGVVDKPAVTNDDILAKYAGGDVKMWEGFLKELDTPDSSNPIAVIQNYKEYIQDMAEVPEKTMNGVIAWGKGGTGKTHNAVDALKLEGMVEGVHFKSVTGSLKGGSDALYGLLYDISQSGVSFIIIDDADNIFNPNYRTIMLHALDNDAKNRVFTVTEKGIKTSEGREIPMGEPFSVADCKFIFCTNKDVSQMDSAFKSRLVSFNFDFTDDEMLTLIGNSLDRMLPDDPTLTKAVKYSIFQMLSAAREKGVLKRVDFRVMTDALFAYSLAVDRGRDPVKAVALVMKRTN